LNEQPNWRFLVYFDSVGKVVAGLTGVVLLITATVSLIYLLWPNPSPPPPPRKATMTIIDSVPNERYRDYLLETGQDSRDFSRAKLRQLGTLYYVQVAVEGLRNRSPQIVWSLRGRVPNKEREDWIHQFLASFTPPADSYARTAKVWIQYPPFPGKFSAVIEIEYPEDESLYVVRTDHFSGRTQPLETTYLTSVRPIIVLRSVPIVRPKAVIVSP
jgi:hypothetical protein